MNPYESGYPDGYAGDYSHSGLSGYPSAPIAPIGTDLSAPASYVPPVIPEASVPQVPLAPSALPQSAPSPVPTPPPAPTSPDYQKQQNPVHAPAPVSGHQQRSLVYDSPAPAFRYQQGTLEGEGAAKTQQSVSQYKSKGPLMLIGISALVLVVIILAVVVFSPTYYTVIVVNANSAPQLEAVSIRKGETYVSSGGKVRQDTQITITWQVKETDNGKYYKGVLWLNGRETDYESGYVHKVTEELVIEIRVVEVDAPPRPGVTHWNDDRIAMNSKFYQRYYVNDVFQRPSLNQFSLEITEPADLGAIAFLSLQNAQAVPSVHTFASYTLQLTKNLDMSEYLWVPIFDFRGSINGNGYTVSGLKIDPIEKDALKFDSFSSTGELLLNKDKEAAFIASVRGEVVISNLTLRGDIKTSTMPTITNQTVLGMRTHAQTRYSNSHPNKELQGASVGANMLISPYVEGAIQPSEITAGQYVEGVIGNVKIRQSYSAAGFVSNILSDGKLSFVNCANYINISSDSTSAVTDLSDAFGFLASQRAARIHLYGLPGRSGQNSLSSIINETGINRAAMGVYFEKCINYGSFNMQAPNYGAAGLAAAATSVTNSANYGNITAVRGNIGGLVIGMHTRDFSIRYSYNWGALKLSGSDTGGAIGGLAVGHVQQSTNGSYIYIRDSANYGHLMSRASTETVVGGILAQYNSQVSSGETAGRLFIQNSLSVGSLDVVEDTEARNFFAGIVARILGNGRADIDVVFVSGVVGAASSRGAAIVDFFPDTLNESVRIRGALWRGTSHLTRVIGFPTAYRNFKNCGRVLDDTGEIQWEERPLSSSVLTLDKASVRNMFTPAEGVMELLRINPDPSEVTPDYAYMAWVEDSLSWIKHSGLGDWGMYLEFSNVSIAKFDFAGGWNAPVNLASTFNNTFVHDVPLPANMTNWVFKGYCATPDGEIIIPKGSADNTKVVAFGETILYEKWVLAV